jgi:predicted RNase H-like HicB family nuclease
MAKAHCRYNIMLRPEPEGGYTALVPALPGCVTYGRTVDEAREMARDAISGYIASLRKHKDPVPSDDNTLVATLDLEYSR